MVFFSLGGRYFGEGVGQFGNAGLLPELVTQGLVTCGVGHGIALAVGAGRVDHFALIHDCQHVDVIRVAYHKVGGFPVAFSADRKLLLFGKLRV